MRRVKKFILNAAVLTATSLLMRTIGVSFNVYISNKLGAAGAGLFQLIMSVYTFAVTVATSGIHLAATRLVTEELAAGSEKGAKRVVRRCLCYSIFFGCAAAGALFFSAKALGTNILGDERTIPSLYALSFSLPFIAMSSVFSGYFTAVRRVVKSASAQLFEQFVRICASVIGLNLLAPDGIQYACLAIVIGGSLAETLSFGYQFLLYRLDQRRYQKEGRSGKKLTKRMLFIALPVAVSAYARSALTTIEHILIPPRLRAFGYSKEEALARYGVVHGMALPVLLFPSAFLTAFSSLLVPEMSECYVRGNTRQIHAIISRVLHTTLIFAIGVSGIFFTFSHELGMAIYQNPEAGMYLKIFAPLVIVMYLDSVVDGMLKGLNQQISSMRYNMMDSLLSVAMVYFLIPASGIGGYVAVIFASEMLNGFLSFNRLIRVTDFKVRYISWVIKPFVAISAAAVCVRAAAYFLNTGVSTEPLAVACYILCTVILYVILLFLMSSITEEDIHFARSVFQREKHNHRNL